MKKNNFLLIIMLLFGATSNAQVGINTDGSTPNASSILHIKGDAVNTNIIIEPGAAGKVGIGLTVPTSLLSLQHDATSGDVFSIYDATNTKTNFVIDQLGKVGIGIAAPTSFLSLQHDGASGNAFSISDGTNTDVVIDQDGKVGIGIAVPTSFLSLQHDGASGNAFSIFDGVNDDFVVNQDGKVGIWTNDPLTGLFIQKSAGSQTAPDASSVLTIYGDEGIMVAGADAVLTLASRDDNTGYATTFDMLRYSDADGSLLSKFSLVTHADGTGAMDRLTFYHGTNKESFNSANDGLFSIMTSGKIGIGSIDPASYLEIEHDGASGNAFSVSDGTNTDFVVNQDGFVGIGVTTPTSLLSLEKATGNSLLIMHNTAPSSGTDFVVTRTAGAKTYVGIATPDPLTSLYIQQNAGSQTSPASGVITNYGDEGVMVVGADAVMTLASRDDNTGAATTIDMLRYAPSDGSLLGKFSIIARAETGSAGSNLMDRVSFYYGTNQNSYSNTELITLKRSGNFGIGTNTPDYPLQVNGTIVPETTDQDLGTSSLKWDFNLNNGTVDEMTINDLLVAPQKASAPSPAVQGQIYYDTGDNKLRVCTAAGSPGTWVDLH